MYTIYPAKSIEGTIRIPPDTDAFVTAALMAIATRIPARLFPVPASSDYLEFWMDRLSSRVTLQEQEDESILCSPISSPQRLWDLSPETLPCTEFSLFLLLAAGHVFPISSLARHTLESWQETARQCGCKIIQYEENHESAIRFDKSDGFRSPRASLSSEELLRCLGIACSLGQNCSVQCHVSPPPFFRHILEAFGCRITLYNSRDTKKEDPITRRLKFLKKDSRPALQHIDVNCIRKPPKQAHAPVLDISIPGDRTFSALLIAARTIIPKGFLALDNVLLEPQSLPVLSFVKRAGASLHCTTDTTTSFGNCGTIKIESGSLAGRKMDCTPGSYTIEYVPAMSIIAAYIRKKNIFKGLSHVRDYTSDPLAVWSAAISHIGVRHGLMPEGIVIEGTKQYDGFDLNKKSPCLLPSYMSGACAVAALRCMGKSTIDQPSLTARWPDFFNIIDTVCHR